MNQSLGAQPRRLAISFVIGVVLFVGACPSISAQPASSSYDNLRDGLRKRAESCNNVPTGCIDVVKDKYVIINDNAGTKKNRYLLIPVPAISGIEANSASNNPLPNYWADAWDWAVGKTGGQVIGLAINSANVRSQDQLHIHIACLAPAAISELKGQAGNIGKGAWKPKIVPFQSLTNHGPYDAIGVPDLSTSPFEWLLKNPSIFSSPSDSQHGMADQTVVVTRVPGGDYYTLARPSGSGEELLTDCP